MHIANYDYYKYDIFNSVHDLIDDDLNSYFVFKFLSVLPPS